MRAVLTAVERRVLARLDTPGKIQDFLDRMPINFERGGDTHMSPRRMLKARLAHCSEGALFAAACLLYHGKPAYLMDLRAVPKDQDHIVTLFRDGAYWGAISKTNHAVLRYRDAIYRSPRELAMSYAHEYFLWRDGRKSLLSFSRPFSLKRFAPALWLTATDELDWLITALDDSPHESLAPAPYLRKRRRASTLERKIMDYSEWAEPRVKNPNALRQPRVKRRISRPSSRRG